jgi:superfamily II DNA or RNA helicase
MEGFLLGLSKKKVLSIVAHHKREFLELPLRDWLPRVDLLLELMMLPDADRVSDVIQHFEAAYMKAGLSMTDLRELHPKLMHALRKAAAPPNNMQLGMAQVLAQLSKINRRQIVVMAGGHGKSRVAATAALILLLTDSSVGKVHLVFPNKLLLEKDRLDFADLWKMTGLVHRVKHCTKLPTSAKPEDAIILDEVDHWVFGNPGRLGKLSHNQRVIGLTATVDDADLGGMEREILQTLGFCIHEKWLGQPA